MKKSTIITVALITFLGLTVITAFAAPSMTGAINLVPAPISVLKGVTQSDTQIILFQEKANYILLEDVTVDITLPGTYASPSAVLTPGEVGANSCLNVYFMHLDLVTGRFFLEGSVTFDEEILGIITENVQLDNSDWLGSPGTFYPKSSDGEIGRRVELTTISLGPDVVMFSEDQKTVYVKLWVDQLWTDQLRVLTQGNCEPEEPEVLEVEIDIKPGSFPSCFNNNGRGVIPVAIFGTDEFDVKMVNIASIDLHGLSVATRGKSDRYLAAYEDINDDGFMDLVIKFDDILSVFAPGDSYATLTGELKNGVNFFGTGDICITQFTYR